MSLRSWLHRKIWGDPIDTGIFLRVQTLDPVTGLIIHTQTIHMEQLGRADQSRIVLTDPCGRKVIYLSYERA